MIRSPSILIPDGAFRDSGTVAKTNKVEHCGDRQPKFDSLENGRSVYLSSLPIMLQIALLLTYGLSRRSMWPVNTSVARVVISFTVLGTLFYVGIVVAGTSSYESPFQMPASTALRHLRGSGRTRKFLAVSHHVHGIPRYKTIILLRLID